MVVLISVGLKRSTTPTTGGEASMLRVLLRTIARKPVQGVTALVTYTRSPTFILPATALKYPDAQIELTESVEMYVQMVGQRSLAAFARRCSCVLKLEYAMMISS